MSVGSVITDDKKRNPDSLSHNPVPCVGLRMQVLNNRQLAFKTYRADSSMANFIAYKKSRAEARKILRQKKRDSFRKFVESINRFTDVGYI